MFARVRYGQGRTREQLEEGIRNSQANASPTLKGLAGFRGHYRMVDWKNGKVLAITLWETEEDLRASDGVVGARQRAAGVNLPGRGEYEVYEVVVQTT